MKINFKEVPKKVNKKEKEDKFEFWISDAGNRGDVEVSAPEKKE
jgi:hypothetical protein